MLPLVAALIVSWQLAQAPEAATPAAGRGQKFLQAVAQLGLSDEQRAQVQTLMGQLRQSGGGAGGLAALAKLRRDFEAILTDEQRKKFRELYPSPLAAARNAATPADSPSTDETPAARSANSALADTERVAKGTDEELARYRRAAQHSAAHAGLSVLIAKDGEVVYEAYHNGHTADDTHQLASGTKSFWGVLAAAAADDGLLTFDEPVADTLVEWKSDPVKSKMTIRHLLQFISGLKPINRLYANAEVKNRYEYCAAQPAESEPGTRYIYADVHLYTFGEVLSRKLKAAGHDEDVLAYLKRRVLDPIGLAVGDWSRDQAGNPTLPYGAILTTREWSKFGELLRQHGEWQGKTLVSRANLDQCFVGSQANRAYGMTFWLNANGGDSTVADAGGQRGADGGVAHITRHGIHRPDDYPDIFMAAGAGQQRLYVLPTQGLVIARQANRNMVQAMMGQGKMDMGFSDDEFIGAVLGDMP